MPHPELQAEQAYLDRAHEFLERMRALVERAPDAAVYVGRRWVHDDAQNPVVVNWQAPAARPFYTATPADPQRVTLRRRFRTQGRRLLDISDEKLDGTALDGASVGDFLLEELERSRDTYMRDIVATIQGDQYRLITRKPDRPLVIQGGPGTGKTAVGLHRASWLLYTHRDTLQRRGVLVVGPNPTFMEYVSHVLPALGETAVEQRAVGELDDVAALVAAAREELGTTEAARERFRMALLRRFYEHYGRRLGAGAMSSFDELERALRRDGYLNRVLAAAWPRVAPQQLVRGLLTSAAK